jgi:hypothetical protein
MLVADFVDPAKIPNLEAIQECPEDADKNLEGALRSSETP